MGETAKCVFQFGKMQYYAQKSFKCPRSKIVSQNSPSINPFLFMKNKRLFISSEGFSTLEKKRSDAAHPFGCDSPL